jgi:hypothetical protein
LYLVFSSIIFCNKKAVFQYMPLHCLKLYLWDFIQYHSNNKIKMEAHALSAGMQIYRFVYDLRYLLFCTECSSHYSGCGLHDILFVIKMVIWYDMTHDIYKKMYSLWKTYEKQPLQLYIGPQWFPSLWSWNAMPTIL